MLPKVDYNPPKYIYSGIDGRLSLKKMPDIRSRVEQIVIETPIYFKLLISKNGIPYHRVKRTYQEFYNMDKDIESKYTKLINEGILSKGVFP